MRAGFDKRWLLPVGILTFSALIALGIAVGIVVKHPASEAAVDCSGAKATDYACYQQRYQNLVRGPGVEAAFAKLKDDYEAKNDFVKSKCHQMTHVIGRTAFEIYGDIEGAYSRGEHFCGTGYYHGVMEAMVAEIGPDKMLEEADTFCAGLREKQRGSDYHYGCAHGLGHAFMGVLKNELFDSLRACDALTDGWERSHCYGGVFMENVRTEKDPNHPSKYLKAEQPLYPCTDVEDQYKYRCYRNQTWYALKTQGNDFAKVFDLCAATVEEEHRRACYEPLGKMAAQQIEERYDADDVAQNEAISELCMLGEDYEARSNCFAGAARSLVYHWNSEAQAEALCESLDEDMGTACLQQTEEKKNKKSAEQDTSPEDLDEEELNEDEV